MKGRAGHTATLVGKDIYVLGGRNGNEFFNDMWVFDTEAEQWKLLQAKAPFSPRAYHTCTLVNSEELWVIGGSDPKTMHSDVHVFDTVSLKVFLYLCCLVRMDEIFTLRFNTMFSVVQSCHTFNESSWNTFSSHTPSEKENNFDFWRLWRAQVMLDE